MTTLTLLYASASKEYAAFYRRPRFKQNQHNFTRRRRCRTGFFIKKNPTSQMLDGYTYADSALSLEMLRQELRHRAIRLDRLRQRRVIPEGMRQAVENHQPRIVARP
jgi:hypothetical protein